MAKKRSKKLRLGLVELITILFMIGGYAAWNSSAKGSTEPSIKRLAKKKKKFNNINNHYHRRGTSED